MASVPHIPYTVLSQQKRRTLINGQTWADVYEITFKGPSGVVSYIEVPTDQYSPEAVDAMIQAELGAVEGVHSLGAAPPQQFAPPPDFSAPPASTG